MTAHTCVPITAVKRSSKIWTLIYRFEWKFSFQAFVIRFLIVSQWRAFNKPRSHILHINWQMAASPWQTAGKVKCIYTIITVAVDSMHDVIRTAQLHLVLCLSSTNGKRIQDSIVDSSSMLRGCAHWSMSSDTWYSC